MNKKINLSVGLMLSVVTLFGIFAVATPVEAMTCDSATITGTVITGTPPTHARFEYSTNYNTVAGGAGTTTPVQYFYTDGTFPIQQFISGLTGNTIYYYRLVVTNNYGTQALNINNFTTPSCASSSPASVVLVPSSQTIYSTSGNVAILSWSGANISSCSGTAPTYNWNESTATTGSKGVSPTSTTTYSITCISTVGGSNPTATAIVNVINNPTNGGWSGWSTKDNSCGITGVQTRTCTNPSPANGGTYCSGVSTQSYTNQACATITNGGWSAWSAQDYSCGTSGVQTRTCSNPSPANGGTYCSGVSTQSYTNQACVVLTCQDPSALNYRGTLPCTYYQPPTTCQDPSALNYRGTLPCTYYQPPQLCQDSSATNYRGTLPCRYSNIQPTVSIYADDTNIDFDESTTIRWSSSNATSCDASGGTNGWAGTRNTSGSFNTGALSSSRTYRITCTNDNGNSDSDSVIIDVGDNNNSSTQSPTVSIYADRTIVGINESTTIRWSSNNATSCSANNGTNGWSGNKNTSGSFNTGSLGNATTYNITCRNNTGSSNDSATVSVNNIQISNQPTVIISADQIDIPYNGTTNIRWNTTNATSCYASDGSFGWAGAKNIGPGSFYTGSLTAGKIYTITCSNNVGSAIDTIFVNVRSQIINTTVTTTKPAQTSLVLITSSVDRNQPIVPTIDNTRPKPGDEINYTVSYQNIGTGAITSLTLRMDLPYEVDYMFSNPNNPTRSGNTLIFNLGTLKANGQGVVTVRVRVRDNIPAGTSLNFPATLSYVDPSGFPQSVTANVSAQVWNEPLPVVNENVSLGLGANVFGAGFLPTNIFGWLLLLILILILIFLAKYLFTQSFSKKTTTTFDQPLGKKTTTTTIQ